MSKVGIVGYCMSGLFVFVVVNVFFGWIEVVVLIYGVCFFGDIKDLFYLDVDKVMVELYFGCVEYDEWVLLEMVDGLDVYLKLIGVDFKIEWYLEIYYGFVFL